jgi:hypothetical protein
MTLESLSFGLAVLLGLIAFGLMKHTADEFDRWYEDQANGIRLRVPVAAFSMLAIAILGAAYLVTR